MVKAVIMAGGHGTRLRPLTSGRPKPMVPVINKPLLEHTINLLKKHGIKDIIMTLYYLPENVQNYFGDGSEWDVNITYSVEEEPLGTAGGVKYAVGNPDDTYIITSGDGLIDFDFTTILGFHKQKKSLLTIVLTRVERPTDYGIVITSEDGKIEKFLEKPDWSQVFSDTVNTGTYIIEPKIFREHIPPGINFDFSFDIFPELQKKKVPLYGYISDDYWSDVGNIESYRNTHIDVLKGIVKIDFPGKRIKENVWAGHNVYISEEAKINGPVFIGNFVRVKAGAEISDYSVIGDNCVIDSGASVRRSLVLHSTHVGPRSELRGAIVGKRCVLEEGVAIYEGSVISDDCEIGKGAEIRPNVRVWPHKIIGEGTKLSEDIIWAHSEQKTLFSQEGITGPFNIKITPEFAAKVGSALGAFLEKDSKVVISRDATLASRLIKWSIISGLLSMGINVYDMDIEAIPLNKFSVKFVNADLGIYVQKLPLAGLQYTQIKIYNKLGFQISIKEEKKIENIFFRGDYPRKDAFEVGRINYPIYNVEAYVLGAKRRINADLLTDRAWEVIVDCSNGAASKIFPELLSGFGCNVMVVRGQMKEFASEEELKSETRKAVNNIVNMCKTNREIGVIIGPHGEYLTIIDENGNILTSDEISALLCLYYFKYKNEKILNIPVTSSRIIEKIAKGYDGRIIRVSTKMRTPDALDDIFQKSAMGRYPYLERDYDPMITFLTILEFITLENSTLYEVREKLPNSNLYKISIPCNTNDKAGVMRTITSNIDKDKIEMIDGIRINKTDSWILILPDATQPLIHLYAEGDTIESRTKILDEFTLKIKKYKSTIK
ncbi:MAG: NTP transferase domain-containing protein [Spirochaetes bacterium]|nr:NTP transferase domain-containing protein [Spirochaetota bacterium]